MCSSSDCDVAQHRAEMPWRLARPALPGADGRGEAQHQLDGDEALAHLGDALALAAERRAASRWYSSRHRRGPCCAALSKIVSERASMRSPLVRSISAARPTIDVDEADEDGLGVVSPARRGAVHAARSIWKGFGSS